MYRRSLEPRWREITVSVILIAIALIALGLLVGRPDTNRCERYILCATADTPGSSSVIRMCLKFFFRKSRAFRRKNIWK